MITYVWVNSFLELRERIYAQSNKKGFPQFRYFAHVKYSFVNYLCSVINVNFVLIKKVFHINTIRYKK